MATEITKERILKAAEKRMLKFGYRKVTMDEIAGDLSMSKNTIYRYFQSKEQIAEFIFKNLTVRINSGILDIESQEKDPLKAISKNILFVQKELSPWFDYFLGEIKTELPQLWEKFIHYRTEKIFEIEGLIKEGIRENEFRHVNSRIAMRAFLGAIDAVINPEVLQKENISFENALEEVMDLWSNGISKTNK